MENSSENMAKLRSDSGISSSPTTTSPNGSHQETENLIKNSCEVEIEDDKVIVKVDECGEFVIDV